MRLAFNIEKRKEQTFLLSEEDSKKVMDKAFELAMERHKGDKEDYLSCYVELATELLLNSNEIKGVLIDEENEKELVSVWRQEE